jgi:tRNA(Glu) U13 pseudouridine synthase TruD
MTNSKHKIKHKWTRMFSVVWSRDALSKLMSIREKLKEKVDDISLEMINETNKYESMYFNNLQSKKHLSLHHLTIQKSTS